MNAAQRTALYTAAGAIVALLGVYGFLTAEQAAGWLAVAGALIGVWGSVTAIRNVTPDTDDGGV